jgi:hypothetical protein
MIIEVFTIKKHAARRWVSHWGSRLRRLLELEQLSFSFKFIFFPINYEIRKYYSLYRNFFLSNIL